MENKLIMSIQGSEEKLEIYVENIFMQDMGESGKSTRTYRRIVEIRRRNT